MEDSRIVCGHHDVIQLGTGFAAVPDVLDQWQSGNLVEGLSGETCRSPARRQDSKDERG